MCKKIKMNHWIDKWKFGKANTVKCKWQNLDVEYTHVLSIFLNCLKCLNKTLEEKVENERIEEIGKPRC